MRRFTVVLLLGVAWAGCAGDDSNGAEGKPKPRPTTTETLISNGLGGEARSGDGRLIVTLAPFMFDRDVTLVVETLDVLLAPNATLSSTYDIRVLPEGARTALNFTADLMFRGIDDNDVARVGASNIAVATRSRDRGTFDETLDAAWQSASASVSATVPHFSIFAVVDAAMLSFCSCGITDSCCVDEWNTCDAYCMGEVVGGGGD